MISIGELDNISLDEIFLKVSEFDILNYYFGITEVPCLINSPFRHDNNPSLGFYTKDGKEILWTDFATKEGGNTIMLLSKFWGESYIEVKRHLWEDLPKITNTNGTIKTTNTYNKIRKSKGIIVECKIREWKKHDIEYWESYGITLKWLKYANVFPISHTIITRDDEKFTFRADKYAYAYVEFKEGKTSIKVYQPFNTNGYKWTNNHDRSVISLWTKIPEYGDKVCVCSSLKDALCLWINVGIPAIAVQGEGYPISETAIKELKRRFDVCYIMLDNDEAGIAGSTKLAEQTGFKNIIMPNYNNCKDLSDYYKSENNKELFKHNIFNLFNYD